MALTCSAVLTALTHGAHRGSHCKNTDTHGAQSPNTREDTHRQTAQNVTQSTQLVNELPPSITIFGTENTPFLHHPRTASRPLPRCPASAASETAAPPTLHHPRLPHLSNLPGPCLGRIPLQQYEPNQFHHVKFTNFKHEHRHFRKLNNLLATASSWWQWGCAKTTAEKGRSQTGSEATTLNRFERALKLQSTRAITGGAGMIRGAAAA